MSTPAPTDSHDTIDGEEVRHFLGVTDSGLRVGLAVTARWRSDVDQHRPIPMSALQGDMRAMTGGGAFDNLLRANDSPLMWPVSAEVYRVFMDDDSPDELRDDEESADDQ